MTMPSRQFLISQACLNVHSVPWWAHWFGTKGERGEISWWLYHLVTEEFRRLEKIYRAIEE